MNELETYVASLQDQGLGKEEIKAKVKAWKLANEPLVEKEEKDPPSKFKPDGSLNAEAFSNETKETAVKANEASKKENDSAKAIPVVESEENTESTLVDSTSESYFTKRGDETILDLEAFGNEITRQTARVVNLPEQNKTYNLGAGAYKVEYKEDGGATFFSKPIGDENWSSADGDPLRTATIAQILGIGDPGFDVDDYDIELPEFTEVKVKDDRELVMGSENLDEVNLQGLIENKNKYKINGQIYSHTEIKNSIQENKKGFENLTKVSEYIQAHKNAGSEVEELGTGYIGSIEEKYDTYVADTTISEDKKIEIERFVNDIDFTPVTKVNFSAGTSSTTGISSGSPTSYKFQPYEKELDRAREILKQQASSVVDSKPITVDQVHGLARELVKNKKIDSANGELKKAFLEDLPEKERLEFFKFILDRNRKNEQIYKGKLPKQVEFRGETIKRKELEDRLDFEDRLEKLKTGGTAKNIRNITTAIHQDKLTLQDLAQEIKTAQANGFDVTELSQKYNSTLSMMNKRIEGVNSYKKDLKFGFEDIQLDYSAYITNQKDYVSDSYEINWLKRNYSQLQKYFGGFGEPGDLLINSASYALGGLQQLLGLIDMGSGLPSSDTTIKNVQEKLLNIQSDFIDYRQKRLERYVEAPTFDNAFTSLSNTGEYLFDQGLEMMPFYAAMIGTTYLTGNPYAGMVVASGTSGGMYAGERYNEMLNGGRQYDFNDMNLAMLGYSSLEFVGGQLPNWKIFKALKGKWSGTVGSEKLLDGIGDWGRRRMAGLPEYVKLIGLDVAGEVAITQAGQNMIDGRPITTGMTEAAFMSLVFSNTMYVAPQLAGGIMSALSTPKMNAEFKYNVALWNTIEASLYDNRFKEKIVRESLTEEQVQEMLSQQADLLTANESILLDLQPKLKNINLDGFKIYSDAMQRLADLQAQAVTINENPAYDRATKEKLLEPLRIEFELTVGARNEYTKAFTKTFNLLPKAERESLKSEAVTSLKINGVINPSESQIFNEAEQIHITKMFEANISKGLNLLKSLKQKGLDVGFALERNNSDLIKRYKKMLDARVKDPKNNLTEEEAKAELEEFTEGIKDGTMNGTTFVSTVTLANGDTKLVYDVVVSQTNSVANQASETTFHELNHVIASEALSTNSDAFKPVASGILSYLADNDPKAYLRITQKADTSKADEVVMAFLEELSGKRINIKKASSFNLWSSLGIGVNNAIKSGTESDFNIDFSGPNGALQFFQTMADAWNNGELTVDALNSIMDSDAWQGDEAGGTLDEVVVIAPKSKRSKLTPKGIELYDGFKEGIYTNKDLVTIVRKKPADQKQRDEQYAAAEAIVEANFGFLKGKLGYERRGVKGIDENGIKQAIVELIIGGDIASWSGKTTPLFEEGEGYNPEFEVTTYLGRLGNRADVIYERAKDLGDIVFNTSELDGGSEGTTEIEALESPEATTIDVDPFKVMKNPDIESVTETVKSEIESGNIDLDKITLKDLKPFSEAAAQQIADQLGIPVSRILDPKDNLRKGEVTPIQMFIKNNAPAFLSILKQIKGNADILTIKNKNSKPIKIGGEGRRLAQKLLDAFYIQLKGADGKPLKVNNQIQYRLDPNKLDLPYFYSVFGMDPSGNIKDARSGTAQAAKGFMELLARLQVLKGIELAIDQQVAEGTKTESEGARQKAQAKRKQEVKRDWKKGKFPVELPLLTKIATSILNSKGVPKKEFDLTTPEGRKFVNTIDDFIKLNPSLGYLIQRGMTGGFSLTFNTVPKFKAAISTEIKKGPIGRVTYSTKGSILNKKAIERFIDDPGLIKKKLDLLKKLFVSIQDYIKKNPDSAPDFARFIADSAADQNHPLRFLAPTVFYPINPITGEIDGTKITEEHMMPATQAAKQLLDAAIKGKVESEFKIIQKSYAQGGLRYNEDLSLKPLGLNEAMPASFYETVIPLIEQGKLDFLPDGLASWIRYSTNNTSNPFEYKLIKPKMTIGEFFVGPLNIKSETGIAIAGEFANGLITKVLTGETTLAEAKAEFKVFKTKVLPLKIKAAKNIDGTFGKKVMRSQTVADKIKILDDYDKARRVAQDINAPVKGISVLDFDDTVGITNSKIVVTMPNGGIRILNATEFALEHSGLEALGAEFDFSDFNKVVDGKRGPLFDKLKKAVDKYGNSNVFILTARAPEAATAIFEWLKSEGVTLKFDNIVGLADGAAQAKANWMVSKVAEGYNDFYFSDDAILNTQAVGDVYNALDIKGTVVQAMRSKQKNFTTIMNDIIEKKTGIEAYKNYSAAKAKTIGAGKGKYNFYIPPSAEDFTGLIYKMLGKGKIGDAQMAFFKDNVLDPYNRAEIEIDAAKISAASDYNALKAAFPKLPKSLKKETGIGKFTFEHAIRAYIWGQQGMTVPGLSKRDLKRLSDFVKADPDLKVFSDELIKMQKGKEYPKPSAGWVAGTITTDIINGINKVNRKLYLQEWQENVDIIFSDAIINKLEAAFGSGYVKALRNSLDAMKRGSNRSSNTDSITEKWYDWINNSVGVVMFLNTRSALLQMISNVNFVNWSDNNPLKAAKAVANQPQYWKDVMFLLNSPYLKSRRDGLKINISESEIADLAASKENRIQGFIALALNKGFVFTRYADSFAIATGGATFYRNRYDSLIKQGMDPETAEKQAFEDFRDISETSQQSSNAAKISDQQRSAAGRLILSFGNTQMQYARIQKRAIQDLINRRGNDKENLSKLVYYSTVQNLMFNALQQGIQFLLFDGDESDEKDQAKRSQRISRTLNGMFDSQVRGLGIQGALTVTLKNTLMTIAEEMGKKSSDYSKAVDDLFSIAPPIQAKLRKLNSSANTFSWNKKEIEKQGIHLNNPAYLAVAQTISALTNIPVDEAVIKINALRNILSDQTKAWQKIALGLGWSTWDVGLPYYGVGEGKELSTEEKAIEEINVMKKETSAVEQKTMLLDLGLTKKEIKDLKYEENRVKKIIELQNKNKK